MTAPQHDYREDYRELRPAARMLSTNHPHAFYWVAAVEAFGSGVFGAVLMVSSVIGGLMVMLIGFACAAGTAGPGYWSERHRDEAAHAVQIQRQVRNQRARRHPAYFLVVVPLIAAGSAALRWNGHQRHHSAASWLIPAALGLVFGVVLGAILVLRARRSTARPA